MRADWYDYPGWYDILHAPGTAREVNGLERIARRFAATGRRAPFWLEPACGSGRYLRVAARRGIRVAGFDLSANMIAYARETFERRGLKGKLFVADMTSFPSRGLEGRVTMAFCPINTIRHLHHDEQMLAHFDRVARCLAPGGVYAVGIETCRYGVDFPAEDVWKGSRGPVSVTQVIQYEPPTRTKRLERVMSHLAIVWRGAGPGRTRRVRGTEHLDSTYELRGYSQSQWTALVRRAGWRVLGIVDADGRDALRVERTGAVVGGHAIWVLAPGAGPVVTGANMPRRRNRT